MPRRIIVVELNPRNRHVAYQPFGTHLGDAYWNKGRLSQGSKCQVELRLHGPDDGIVNLGCDHCGFDLETCSTDLQDFYALWRWTTLQAYHSYHLPTDGPLAGVAKKLRENKLVPTVIPDWNPGMHQGASLWPNWARTGVDLLVPHEFIENWVWDEGLIAILFFEHEELMQQIHRETASHARQIASDNIERAEHALDWLARP